MSFLVRCSSIGGPTPAVKWVDIHIDASLRAGGGGRRRPHVPAVRPRRPCPCPRPPRPARPRWWWTPPGPAAIRVTATDLAGQVDAIGAVDAIDAMDAAAALIPMKAARSPATPGELAASPPALAGHLDGSPSPSPARR